jgi:heat shock protein HslJ
MIDVLALAAFLSQATASPAAPATQAPPAAYEGEWLVEVVDHIKVLPESRITLTIRGTLVSGAASCNTYRGDFTTENDRVRVGQLLRTMKACDGPRMSEEGDFFTLLQAVVKWEVRSRDTLLLTTRDGRVMTAKRVALSSQRQ